MNPLTSALVTMVCLFHLTACSSEPTKEGEALAPNHVETKERPEGGIWKK